MCCKSLLFLHLFWWQCYHFDFRKRMRFTCIFENDGEKSCKNWLENEFCILPLRIISLIYTACVLKLDFLLKRKTILQFFGQCFMTYFWTHTRTFGSTEGKYVFAKNVLLHYKKKLPEMAKIALNLCIQCKHRFRALLYLFRFSPTAGLLLE